MRRTDPPASRSLLRLARRLERDEKQLNVKIPAALLERFRRACRGRGLTQAEVVEALLADWANGPGS